MNTDRAAGFAKNMLGKAERAVGEAAGDGEMQAAGAARQAEGVVQNTIEQAKDFSRTAAKAATDIASDAYASSADAIAARPGSSLLAAGIIGFALGVLLTKGSRPPRRSRWQRIYDLD
jgi:uncharacterized protein YjbJ (UPF0337 family)